MTQSTPRSGSSRQQAQNRQRRRAAIREALYVLAMLSVAGAAYFGFVLFPNKLRTQDLRADHDAVVSDVVDLQESIATLRRDTRAMNDDPWVVERALRGRLGYLRPGERVFRPGS